MLEILPRWLVILLISMLPIVELRGAIPVALGAYNMNPWIVFPVAVIGNMIPVPFILLFFGYAEKYLRKYKSFDRFFNRLFEKTRKRADMKIKRYETLGLLAFVAVPLPFTGAWTGALIAYLFGLKFWKSILTIFMGVIVAGFIVTAVCITGKAFWFLI
ncbi:MAG: small multi-drug export protein [Candidatus Thermoplasmatota archaeon]|nr:small multi-drug export protein [Candidatus Thermoplasmatota archaeon]MBU4189576.1 small multi-drug export protein [Candidatus Thermoplasmatota archaeon]